jgi:acetoin utilization deacetylase AcuC-like enzyme
MGDGDYMYAFQQVVMPIAQEFNPDLVISMQMRNPVRIPKN